MFRAPDPWSEQEDEEPLTCGFPAGLHDKYDLDEKVIGKGGFGAVRVARSRATGNMPKGMRRNSEGQSLQR
jgi:hypothetical protein